MILCRICNHANRSILLNSLDIITTSWRMHPRGCTNLDTSAFTSKNNNGNLCTYHLWSEQMQLKRTLCITSKATHIIVRIGFINKDALRWTFALLSYSTCFLKNKTWSKFNYDIGNQYSLWRSCRALFVIHIHIEQTKDENELSESSISRTGTWCMYVYKHLYVMVSRHPWTSLSSIHCTKHLH